MSAFTHVKLADPGDSYEKLSTPPQTMECGHVSDDGNYSIQSPSYLRIYADERKLYCPLCVSAILAVSPSATVPTVAGYGAPAEPERFHLRLAPGGSSEMYDTYCGQGVPAAETRWYLAPDPDWHAGNRIDLDSICQICLDRFREHGARRAGFSVPEAPAIPRRSIAGPESIHLQPAESIGDPEEPSLCGLPVGDRRVIGVADIQITNGFPTSQPDWDNVCSRCKHVLALLQAQRNRDVPPVDLPTFRIWRKTIEYIDVVGGTRAEAMALAQTGDFHWMEHGETLYYDEEMQGEHQEK